MHINLFVYFFMIFIVIYIYSYVYLCIYKPSYQLFKAFSVSKFNTRLLIVCILGWKLERFQTKFPNYAHRQNLLAGLYVCMFVWMKKKKTDKVTFDWCLSQLVVAVRLWFWTTSYVGTECGPQIWSRNDQWRSTRKWGLEIRLCA